MRKGKVENHGKNGMKSQANITQQKGKKSHIQMQKAHSNNRQKNWSEKIALDARALHKAIDKDKYHMPNLDNSIDMVAKRLEEDGNVWYSSVDLTYAYEQVL